MTSSPNRNYIPAIDQIRAFAALLVFFYHGFYLFGAQLAFGEGFDATKHWVVAGNPIVSTVAEGHTGVGLFIVLSGFVLSLGCLGKSIDYRKFLLARFLRIYPVLILCLAVVLAINRDIGLLNLLTLAFPTGIRPSSVTSISFGYMFWAVAVEFQCYFLFPLLIVALYRNGPSALWQVILLALVLRALAVFAEGASARDVSYWTILGRIDQFCLGILAARIYNARRRETARFWHFAAAGAAASLILWAFNRAGGWPAVVYWKVLWPTVEGVMWAAVIVTFVSWGRWTSSLPARAWAYLGEISYSFYLLHFPVLLGVIRHGLYLQPTGVGYYDALITTALVAFPITAVVAVLTYRVVEKPFLASRPHYVIDKPSAPDPERDILEKTAPSLTLRSV